MPRLTGMRTMLEANSVKETVDFYEKRLGFSCTGTWGHDMSEPTWCNLTRDGISLMFSHTEPHEHDDGTVHEAHTPEMSGSIYLYADDIDAMYESMKQRGNEFEWEPSTWDHGMRDFGLRDCNGYLLIFGMPVASGG